MIYRNVKTGGLVSTDCEISGEDWVPETQSPASGTKDQKPTAGKTTRKKRTTEK